jgi:hypothetical protein
VRVRSVWRPNAALLLAVMVLGTLFVATAIASSTTRATRSAERELTQPAEEGSFEVLEAADQYAEARTAPADVVSARALITARGAAAALPTTGGPWSELTPNRYDSDAAGYRDPVWSNSGGGAGLVGGRMTSLAVDGSTVYGGAADGGVWEKVGNSSWQPLTDTAATLSIGALAVDSSHGLWVGTGEANTSSDSYAGIGVLYKASGSPVFSHVGGDELLNSLIGRLTVDPSQGVIYAATSTGLYRRPLNTGLATPWTKVLGIGVGFTSCSASGGAPGVVFISDVAVKPGTNGQTVAAVVGWRAGSNCNGIFVSNDYGQHFSRVSASGSLNDRDLGRTSIAYSADGSKLYALVQSASMFNQVKTDFGGTVLQGVFVSPSGSAAGPWNTIAEWRNLANSGSALKLYLGYHPGVQAWYNQFLAVDSANANHLFLGLEEVFETSNGGVSWRTDGPYWNFGLCSDLNTCPKTTHPDQHAIAIANGTVWVGNDGGVYSRGLNSGIDGPTRGWTNLNSGLRTLQYYYAAAGRISGGDAVWGGLQDNGVSLLNPGSSTMVSPFGGDGGDNIVDPDNGDRAVNEYVGLDMALTTNGGRSDGTVPAYREITPACGAFTYTPSPCDPSPRFIAPFRADAAAPNDHWVAGGRYVWDSTRGWDTHCSSTSCDWHIAYDTGAGHSITAIGVNTASYVGWCGPCNSVGFARGLATNYGGTWHAITLPSGFPNRFVNALTVDPANPAHVYLVFNGFSRRWTNEYAGEGHVFESTNAGSSWTDISNDLPDIPGDDLLLTPSGKLVYATDVGMFTANAGQGASTSWSNFGTGLPNASVNDLSFGPGNGYIIAATHGRGLWNIATP